MIQISLHERRKITISFFFQALIKARPEKQSFGACQEIVRRGMKKFVRETTFVKADKNVNCRCKSRGVSVTSAFPCTHKFQWSSLPN